MPTHTIESSPELQPSSVFAQRYRVLRRLGGGAFGSVYESVHLVTSRPCALKVLQRHLAKDPQHAHRFLREARVTAQLPSTHIVDVLDAGIDAATHAPFMVMELLRGEDMAQRLRRKTRFSIDETLIYLSQVAAALELAHQRSVVHRDLKPANLFLTTRADGNALIKVLDFGVAKLLVEQSLLGATGSAGTPLYMAPEQFGSQAVTPQVDLYALGLLGFVFLVGEHYYRLEAQQCLSEYALASSIARGPTEAASARAPKYGVSLPPAFDAWFARAAHPNPNRRHVGAREAIVDLCFRLGRRVPEALQEVPAATRVGAPSRDLRALSGKPRRSAALEPSHQTKRANYDATTFVGALAASAATLASEVRPFVPPPSLGPAGVAPTQPMSVAPHSPTRATRCDPGIAANGRHSEAPLAIALPVQPSANRRGASTIALAVSACAIFAGVLTAGVMLALGTPPQVRASARALIHSVNVAAGAHRQPPRR